MKATIIEALERLPGPQGERFATVFQHGSLLVEIYAPRGTDPQKLRELCTGLKTFPAI
ncbi:MAG TPA: hypothetical protein VJ875_10780 [Pyrinomonadaceae bacterium]|nr:hypothetical protein [Pyrinomonadaceae bacterium]